MKIIKNIICISLSALTGIMASSCSGSQSADLNLKALDLKNIVYEMSSYEGEGTVTGLTLVSDRNVETGQQFYVTVNDTASKKEPVYFIVDWGDGTWSYNGAVERGTPLQLRHSYKHPGTYAVRTMSVSVANGSKTGFSQPFNINVTGEEYQEEYITTVKAIGSESASGEFGAENIIDNKDTYWRSKSDTSITSEQWVGLRLDSHYQLDNIEIKIPKEVDIFPQNIAIEYTTDGGATWYHLPKTYYLEDHHKERGDYNPVSGFPHPSGATLSIALDGIVANGIRICSKLFPISDAASEKYFAVEEMRVTGDKRPLYYSSYGGQWDADLNNMYSIYTEAKTEVNLYGLYWGNSIYPFEGGSKIMTVTDWYEWDSMQIIWQNEPNVLKTYTDRLFETKISNDTWGNYGLIWQDPVDMKHMKHQSHYDLNAKFIIVVRDYLYQQNDKSDILSITNSQGLTMAKRIDDAMKYQLEALKGKDGLLIIGDPENNGTLTGNASTYWDAYTCDGYISTNCNIFFYASLLAMADIQVYRGADDAQYYLDLAETVKKNINEKLWDEKKGRYIMSIDINGEKHDYGTTYMNVEAVAYGVADKERAKRIYEWLDGKRIIEGDTSTGKDIYGAYQYAARANTVDVSAGGPPFCWENWSDDSSTLVGALDPQPGQSAGYGYNIQNGGAIFYTTYYDIMGRKIIGMDRFMDRFNTVMEEFHKDQLRRRRIYSVATDDGVLGEFPESGIVPLVFQDGILGISTRIDGIKVEPSLPGDMNYAGIRSYWYNNQEYSIKVSKDIKKPSIKKVDHFYFVQLPADGAYLITKENQIKVFK